MPVPRSIHFLCLLLTAGFAHAELKLASPFTDHTVLQREIPVPVWGKADAGAEVTLAFGEQSKTTTADEKGKWSVTIDPLPGSSTPADLVVKSGSESITRTDIVVGEVWLCSGQSNMQMGHRGVPGLENLSTEGIRTLEVKRSVAFTEQDSFEGEWAVSAPGSAVAFSFAHHGETKGR